METIMMIKIVLTGLLFLQNAVADNRPPHIYMPPTDERRDVYFRPGQYIELLCNADGIPRPQFSWRRNGEAYNISAQDGRVVQLPNKGNIAFIRPEAKDKGFYQCLADNGYGISAAVPLKFRVASVGKFPDADAPQETHRVEAGMDLTLPCIPPQSSPPADMVWIIKGPHGYWEGDVIRQDERISIDIEGRLRFTNVNQSDSQDGRAYTCMASNPFLRDRVFGPEHVIEVLGATEVKQRARELWTSQSHLLVLRGELLRMKCVFAGNPTPDVSWDKVNGTLSERAKVESFGQELQISDVQMSDAGQYECMGSNEVSTQRAAKSFHVQVKSAPYWIDEPESYNASINEDATFICRAFGDPPLKYTWFINGVPLADGVNELGVRDPRIYQNNRFYKPNENNITLTKLTLEDHMNIQCNVSNTYGYVFSDVYLNILDETDVDINTAAVKPVLTPYSYCVYLLVVWVTFNWNSSAFI